MPHLILQLDEIVMEQDMGHGGEMTCPRATLPRGEPWVVCL